MDRDFTLTEQNAESVARICHRLDGLPLALELAAARIRVLPPDALQRRLDHAVSILIGGARDAPDRHRTLHETIGWSYHLLSEGEQQLFRWLGCFVGGWTLEAAEAIVESHTDLNVFETLASLIEKNLVRLDRGSSPPRYVMLETIRDYAQHQLHRNREDHAVRDRHATWCLAVAEEAEPALEGFGGTQVMWLDRLDREVDNIRAALGWLDQIGDASRLLRLVTVLDTFWYLRPRHAEVVSWLARGLQAPDLPLPIRAAALNVAVYVICDHGESSQAIAYAEEGLAVAEAWGDPFALGRAHFTVGQVWLWMDDAVRAIGHFSQAIPWFREASATSWEYLVLSSLGSALHLSGDLESAVPLLDRALALVRLTDRADPRALDDQYGLCQVLGSRAHVARAQGDVELATRLFVEKLTIARELGVVRELLGALAGLAGIAFDRGQPARAARLLGAVDAARRQAGQAHIIDFQHVKRLETLTRDALGEGAWQTWWHEGQTLSPEAAIDEALALSEELLGPGN
jgi:non-specific serine/threonine protein kinase